MTPETDAIAEAVRLLCLDVHPTYVMGSCTLCARAVDALHRRGLLAVPNVVLRTPQDHEHNVACAFGSPTCPAFDEPPPHDLTKRGRIYDRCSCGWYGRSHSAHVAEHSSPPGLTEPTP